MNNNLQKNYKLINDILGLPQEYKGVNLYPIKIGETDYNNSLHRLFFWPKNYIPDVAIIKTSYIKYLLFPVQLSLKEKEPETDLEKEFIDFMSHITHVESSKIHFSHKDFPEGKSIYDKFILYLFIDGIQFTEQDIDSIREIILEQNGSSIEWVEDYKPDLEEKLSFMQRDKDNDLKDIIYTFCCLTNMSEEEACNKTIFQFNSRLEREIMVKNYHAFKPLEVSGQISSKNKSEEIVKNYLSHIPKQGRYDSILVDMNKFMEDSGLNNSESPVKFEN